jgi:hypothetical protein
VAKQHTQPISENTILSRFSKSGDLSHLSAKFRKLPADRRRMVIEMISKGSEPELALEAGRTGQRPLF